LRCAGCGVGEDGGEDEEWEEKGEGAGRRHFFLLGNGRGETVRKESTISTVKMKSVKRSSIAWTYRYVWRPVAIEGRDDQLLLLGFGAKFDLRTSSGFGQR
jgi:hypothetical protein